MIESLDFNWIGSLLGVLLGGGAGGFASWWYAKRKAKAETFGAEIGAAKELQELYKDFLTQAKEDFEERKTQIEELREERDRYKDDRNDLRDRLEKMEESLRKLQSDYTSNKMESDRKIAQLGRKVEGMRPFLCGDIGCKKRQLVTLFAKEENDDGGNTQ